MQARYISFLDLMCCGFGGALLMFLIVASSRPRIETSQPMLIVRCRATTDATSSVRVAGAEIGLEYRRVGADEWIRANGPPTYEDLAGPAAEPPYGHHKWVFFPTTASGQAIEAVLICPHPRPGRWEFRAYLADFPASQEEADDAPMNVALEFLGAVEKQPESYVLLTPGSTTPAVSVEIRAAP